MASFFNGVCVCVPLTESARQYVEGVIQQALLMVHDVDNHLLRYLHVYWSHIDSDGDR